MLQITRSLRVLPPPARPAFPGLAFVAAMATSAAPAEPEILHRREGALGVVTLNRPRALNALTTAMVEALHDVLAAFEADPSCAAVAIEGAGGRAFCAGGDVKAVVTAAAAGRLDDAFRFFRSEYRTNYKISRLAKPYIALIDGITMGGGAGVSMHGTFRIATERTVFAMPECAIGLIPDIGASHFLTRLPGGLGLYLGLTGARLAGADVLHAGLATHYVPSDKLGELRGAVAALGAAAGDERALGAALAGVQACRPVPAGDLPARRPAIDAMFSGKASLEEVYTACEAHGEFGRATAEAMAKGSPTSQRAVFEALRRGAGAPLAECLRTEHRVVRRLVTDPASDFHEGVDATLISKSGAPRWRPGSLGEVTAAAVARLFDPLPPAEELQLPEEGGSGGAGPRQPKL